MNFYKNTGLQKKLIGKIWDGTKIFLVCGKYVRDKIYTDFTEGGHGYVYNFIPKNEIWVEELPNKNDMDNVIAHEIYEYTLMRYLKIDYESAHDKATSVEKVIRTNNPEHKCEEPQVVAE
jgi:hypothetical protein